MNDVRIHLALLQQANDGAILHDALDAPHETAPAPLTNQDIRELYVADPTPQTAALSNELYRMRALLRRIAQFLDLAQQRGIEQSLDITSRTLMRGLARALESEPAIVERPVARATVPAPVEYRCQAYGASTQRWYWSEHQTAGADGPVPAPAEIEPDERERLFTWKLLPEPGRGAQVWQNVSYRGVVIVRAYDPVQARKLAAEKLTTASHAPEKGGRAALSNPWRKRSLVRVELAPADDSYDKIMVPSVVYP